MLRNKGNNFLKQEKFDEAIQCYEQAMRLNPNDMNVSTHLGHAYAYRGGVYYAKKDYDKAAKAIDDLTRAIQLDANTAATAYALRGIVYRDKEDYDKAIDDLTQAMRLNPNDMNVSTHLWRAYALRGKVYYEKEDYDKAREDSARALQLDPNNKLARNTLEKIRTVRIKT